MIYKKYADLLLNKHFLLLSMFKNNLFNIINVFDVTFNQFVAFLL